jgi:hypothetical protein
MERALASAVLMLVVVGCAGSSLRAAASGDLNDKDVRAALRNAIDAKEKVGKLSNEEAADLARVVASREVASASAADATLRVREVRACAPDLDDALEQRMKVRDAAGAEAAFALLEARELDSGDARSYAGGPDDAWRAFAVRGLVRDEDGPARARALVDASPRVRRAAIAAAVGARDGALFDALSETARLDPEPLVRTDAVRALGALAPPGSDLANRLRDLWTNADDALREDIASAWVMPAVYGAGGHEAVRVLLASKQGPGVLAAAGAILRAPHVKDVELEASARAILARAIEAESRRNRLHAIAIVPLVPKHDGGPANALQPILEAVRKASKDEDPGVRLAALARLLESAADRAEATFALEAMAGQKEPSALASRARLALAHAGDVRIQAWIEQDLSAHDAEARLSAVDALAALGRSARGAPLLADPDPSVRTRAACTLLLAARTR